MMDERRKEKERELVPAPARPIRKGREQKDELPPDSLEIEVMEILKSRETPRRWREE